MFFKAILSNFFAKDARIVAKRTEEVLAPMDIEALKAYSTRLENQRKTANLIARIFSDSIDIEAANSSTATKQAVNS